MNSPSDETVMMNVKNGDLASLSVLFERYHVRLYNYFLRMGLDRDSGQDLTQNLFYRIIKYRNSYHEGSPVKAWIYQMARNLLTDYYLQEKKENDIIEKASSELKGSADVFREEDYRRLDSAMMQLPESQRELIVLSRYQQLRYSDISSVTGLSVPAIKVAIHRAIKQLRTIYLKQLKIDEK